MFVLFVLHILLWLFSHMSVFVYTCPWTSDMWYISWNMTICLKLRNRNPYVRFVARFELGWFVWKPLSVKLSCRTSVFSLTFSFRLCDNWPCVHKKETGVVFIKLLTENLQFLFSWHLYLSINSVYHLHKNCRRQPPKFYLILNKEGESRTGLFLGCLPLDGAKYHFFLTWSVGIFYIQTMTVLTSSRHASFLNCFLECLNLRAFPVRL